MGISRKQTISIFLLVLTVLVGFSWPAQSNLTANTPDLILSQPLTVRWRYASNVTLNLTPAFDNERVYLPLAGGTLVSLKANDGQLFWRSDIGGELSASPIADNSTIYVASEAVAIAGLPPSSSGTLRALGREGGVTQWMMPLVKPLRGALALSGERVFAGGSDGRIYAFDKRTGGVFWSILFGSPFSGQPVIQGGRVYLGSEDGTLYSLEEATGRLLWKFKTKGAIRGPVAVAEGMTFFGSGDGYVYAVSADKGKMVWQKRTGGGVEAVSLAGDALLAASLDNFAYLLKLNGKMIWKKLLPGRISSQPLTMQEAALFTPLSSSNAVVLALRDGKQVNSLATGEELTSSAAPIIVGDTIIVTTEHGLLAFSRPPITTKPAP
jgi:outer membrane protein assembly factor BamB